MQEKRILIVDDEATVRNTVRLYLEQEKYRVQTAVDGSSALQEVQSFQPDLIILDVMLPTIDGIEVLRQLRRESDVYVLLLTAKADEVDKVIGLTMGADDYLTKPFSPRELVARVQAILRRGRAADDHEPTLQFAQLSIDPVARQVKMQNQLLDLTPTEYELLLVLARHKGRVLSREQLIESIWGYDYFGDARVIDTHIRRLRRKIGEDPSDPQYIATVRGAGYRFDGAER